MPGYINSIEEFVIDTYITTTLQRLFYKTNSGCYFEIKTAGVIFHSINVAHGNVSKPKQSIETLSKTKLSINLNKAICFKNSIS